MGTTPCTTCGHIHPGCTAHTRSGPNAGQPCQKPPLRGATICASHGANGRTRAAAARNLAEQEAARQVATLGLPVDITPTEALLEEVRWTAGHVQWLRGKVQELGDQVTHYTVPEGEEDEAELFSNHPNHARHGLTWGTTKVVDKGSGSDPGIDKTETAAPSIWYELYTRERAHLVTVCQAAIKAGVEERRVRLAESQGDLVATAIGRILDALLAALIAAGLGDALRTVWTETVPVVVPRELRALAGGAA